MLLSDAWSFWGCGDSPNGHRRFVTRRLTSGDAGGVLHSKIGSIWTSEKRETQLHKHTMQDAMQDDLIVEAWIESVPISTRSSNFRKRLCLRESFWQHYICVGTRESEILVVVWAVLHRYFRFSGVSETEMVSFEALDASMIGCSTPYDS